MGTPSQFHRVPTFFISGWGDLFFFLIQFLPVTEILLKSFWFTKTPIYRISFMKNKIPPNLLF